MKIAVSTSGDGLDAPLESRFGRAPKFLVYDIERRAFELIDNAPNLNAAQGAGIQSAQTVVRAGAGAVITGHCGPRAFRVLSSAGIKIYSSGAATVEEALDLYRQGRLVCAETADVEGHW